MKQSTYTRTALASLLTLCSFGGFAADFSDESIKKQESAVTSGKMEVMKTSNKKLKEKMDRICNADPKKKAEELKKKEELKLTAGKKRKEELAEKKKKEEAKLASKEQAKLAKDSKAKTLNVKNSNIESSKTKSSKTQKAKIEAKAVNKNIEEKGKASPVVSVGGVDITDTNQGASGLRITFGGVVDAKGYGKAGPDGEDYKRYNIKAGKSVDYYKIEPDKIKGANPLFPGGIGNIGDYSEDMGMIADAILHLRAENKNEDLGLLYGADVQFHVPVTEGKGASQGVNAARSRSAHVFLNSKYGDLKLGYQFGPEALMRLDATRIATVDGAADSDWFRKVNLEGSAASFPFYVTPRLYTESFSSESERFSFRMAGKYNKGVLTTLPFRIAYYSPSYMGAKFGVSYSPRYESSLFSVSDSMNASPFKAEIDNITSAFVDASKLKFNSGTEISGKKYKSADDAINDLVKNVTFAGSAATQAEKAAALDEAVKILPAIGEGTAPTGYAKYGITDFPSSITAVTKPGDGTAMKAKLITLEPTLNTAGGTKDQFVEKLKETVSKLLNDGPTTTDVKTAVEKQFLDKVVNKMLYDGAADSAIRHIGPDYEHIISAGALYEYDFSQHNIKVKTSVVGEYGKAKEPNKDKHLYKEFVEYNDLMGVNLGVSADYKINEDQSVKLAASFAYLGKSGQPKNIKELDPSGYKDITDNDKKEGLKQFEKDTMYWTAGAGYQYESFYTSLTYFGSTMNDGDKLHDVALGVQYDLSPTCSKSKFVPYAALHYFMTDEKQADSYKITKAGSGTDVAPSNKGVLFLTGVKFSF
ncbi:WD0745 family porin [Wolbachia endosymbiont of Cimex lectularius]|uniref:WD0745 family porin n=1 Tax=Wolbachia endosymbiont of Cimex lectularius TaxID=246273 RepID=UPI00049A0B5F|nr:porin [Wolbachia endosymbiont of Cimex lectularius]BAO99601.1 putative outer membrane protein [Wolbachia endosymbiont of Cimex lectularius]